MTAHSHPHPLRYLPCRDCGVLVPTTAVNLVNGIRCPEHRQRETRARNIRRYAAQKAAALNPPAVEDKQGQVNCPCRQVMDCRSLLWQPDSRLPCMPAP